MGLHGKLEILNCSGLLCIQRDYPPTSTTLESSQDRELKFTFLTVNSPRGEFWYYCVATKCSLVYPVS